MSRGSKRYRAFISYSQRDKSHARRLHSALEVYRFPKGAAPPSVDQKTRRLGRIFRDDDEMGAAADLGAALRGAIADAEHLIVVCSPNAAQSRWVDAEIRHFKQTGRAANIFAVVVDGRPNGSDSNDTEQRDQECFPPALRFELGSDGKLSDRRTEPLAIDLRTEPFKRACARLIAGLVGEPFDTIWRRDLRRSRRRMAATLSASVVVLLGAMLGAIWIVENRNVQNASTLAALSLSATERGDDALGRRLALAALRTPAILPPPHDAKTALRRAAHRIKLGSKTAEMHHEANVTRALFVAGGKLVVSLSSDKTARLWDAVTGRQLKATKHGSAANNVLLSNDRSQIMTWSNHGDARTWRVDDGSRIAAIPHGARILGATWMAGDRRIMTWSRDGLVRISNSGGGELLTLIEHGRGFKGATLSPNESRIATWDDRGRVALWNGEDGSKVAGMAHADRVNGGQFSPDGKRLLTWSHDGTARFWDAKDGRELGYLTHSEDFSAWIDRARFVASGFRIVTSGSDGTVRVWQAHTGHALQTLQHAPLAKWVFAEDGIRLATWAADNAIRLWDVRDGRLLGEMKHDGRISSVSFVNDDELILSWSEDGTARLWSARDGSQRVAVAHQQRVTSAELSDNGGYLLTASWDGAARVSNAISGQTVQFLDHDGPILGATFSKDQRSILTWGSDGIVRVSSAVDISERALTVHLGSVNGSTFIDGDKRVLSWSEGGNALIWSASNGALEQIMEHDFRVRSAFRHDDGTRIVTIGAESSDDRPDGRGGAFIWSPDQKEPVASLGHQGGVRGLRVSPDQGRALTWGDDRTIRLSRIEDGALLALMEHDVEQWLAVDVDWTGDRVVTWARDETEARLWRIENGSEIATLEHGAALNGAAIWPGSRIATWGDDGVLRFWSAKDGAPTSSHEFGGEVAFVRLSLDRSRAAIKVKRASRRQSLESETSTIVGPLRLWDVERGVEIAGGDPDQNGRGGISGAVFSPDNSRLLIWADDGDMALWDAVTGEVIAELAHEDRLRDVRFSHDSRFIATAGVDQAARLWSAETGALLHSLKHETSQKRGVNGTRFSDNGELLLTWGMDATVRLWQTSDGALLGTSSHVKPVWSAKFSQDQSKVLSHSSDGSVKVWSIATLLDEASRRELGLTPLAEAVCTGQLGGSLRIISSSDIALSPLLAQRLGEDVCGPKRSMSDQFIAELTSFFNSSE